MLVTKNFIEVLDDFNEIYFYEQKIPVELQSVVPFIAERQIKESFKIGSFSLSTRDYQLGKWLFTGERLVTNLAIRTIASIDATRILVLSSNHSNEIMGKIDLAKIWMEKSCFSKFCSTGECKHSSTAYARYLASINQEKNSKKLSSYVKLLSKFRNNNNKWSDFPFYFTLLTLLEIDTKDSLKELQFASPACEKNLKLISNSNPKFQDRRLEIIKRVLGKTYSIF